jgi:hypothetical protein
MRVGIEPKDRHVLNMLRCCHESCLENKNAMPFCYRLGCVPVEKMLSDCCSERAAAYDDDIERPCIRSCAPRGIRVWPWIWISANLRLKKRVTDVASDHIPGEISKFAS